ncbi:MAG: thioredoxin family protein [Butyrivibrio sp.]|nr:thioredoxin family protein [Butyrivibrio sp.]
MIHLNKNENLDDILKTNGLVIIQFGSESCGPCFSIKHKIDDWLSTHPSVFNRYIPVENYQAIAAQHNVFGVPTTILYCQGKEIIRRSRYYSLDEILTKGEDLLKIMENN